MTLRRISVLLSTALLACVPLTGGAAAAGPLPADTGTVVAKSGDALVVTAAAGVANDITVKRQGSVILVSDAGDTVTAVAPCEARAQDTAACPLPVAELSIRADDADDDVTVSPNVEAPATLYGGGGDDQLNGGPRADRIVGDEPGVTRAQATPGNDTINGGPGNDTLSGLDGNDTINGNAGNDTLNGNAGNDTVNGNAGNDTLNGDSGNDTLNGAEGNDTLNAVDGVSANDSLDGGLATDFCNRDTGDTAINCP